jgi:hypothetical protein
VRRTVDSAATWCRGDPTDQGGQLVGPGAGLLGGNLQLRSGVRVPGAAAQGEVLAEQIPL